MKHFWDAATKEIVESNRAVIHSNNVELQVVHRGRYYNSALFDFSQKAGSMAVPAHMRLSKRPLVQIDLKLHHQLGKNYGFEELVTKATKRLYHEITLAHELGHVQQFQLGMSTYPSNLSPGIKEGFTYAMESDAWERAAKLSPTAAQTELWETAKSHFLGSYNRTPQTPPEQLEAQKLTLERELSAPELEAFPSLLRQKKKALKQLNSTEIDANVEKGQKIFRRWARIKEIQNKQPGVGSLSRELYAIRPDPPPEPSVPNPKRRPIPDPIGQVVTNLEEQATVKNEFMESLQAAAKNKKIIGGVLAAAAVGGLIYHHKNRNLPHIRSHGRVQKHPHNDRVGIHKENAALAGVLSGVATTALGLVKPNLSPSFRRNLFFGLTFGAGYVTDSMRGDDPAVAVSSNILSTAAGYVAYAGIKKVSSRGVQAFAQSLDRNGANSIAAKALKGILDAKKNFPLLNRFMSKETLGIAGAIATIPFAHSFIHKLINHFHHSSFSTSYPAMLPSLQHNQAGRTDGRIDHTPELMPNQSGSSLNLHSTLRSHYNIGHATRDSDIKEMME